MTHRQYRSGALFAAATLALMIAGLALPNGMDACQAHHGFDTCHNALFR